MGPTIRDCVFHNDGNHQYLDLCNAYLFTGGTYYQVRRVFLDYDGEREFTVIRNEEELSPYLSCLKTLSYFLVIPTIIAYVGLIIGRCLYNYHLPEPEIQAPPPRPPILIPERNNVPEAPPIRPIPFSARPVVSQPLTTSIPANDLLRLKNYLSYNLLPYFKVQDGHDLYSCELINNNICIRNRLAPYSAKIKFKVDDQGTITSFHLDIISLDTIPDEDEGILLGAIEKMKEIIGAATQIEQKEAEEKHGKSLNELLPAEDLIVIKTVLTKQHNAMRISVKGNWSVTDMFETAAGDWSIKYEEDEGSIKHSRIIIRREPAFGLNRTIVLTFETETGRLINCDSPGDNTKALLQECYKEALRQSSTYKIEANSREIYVRTVHRGLQIIPSYHLESFAKSLGSLYADNRDPTLRVHFLDDRLNRGDGSDAGGLSRTYLDSLVTGLKQDKAIDVLPDGSVLALPKTKNAYNENDPNIPPRCNEDEESMYYQLGKLMKFSYESNSDRFTIGRHFHNALFQVLSCLDANHVNLSFRYLHMSTRVEMHEALIENVSDWNFSQSRTILKFLKKSMNKSFQGNEKNEAIEYVRLFDDSLKPEDLQEVETLKTHLHRLLMSTAEHACLAPIHAIARGIMDDDIQKWETTYYGKNPQEIALKIQGIVDRQVVAGCFKITVAQDSPHYTEISTKVTWLQEWIAKEATEQEISDLLRYFTGCSGMPQGQEIQVMAQSSSRMSPYPLAHTCSLVAEFAPRPIEYVPGKGVRPCPPERNTKQAFIDIIKKAISDQTYQMS